jgi:REP element-mobilizing transposase RayT
MTMPRSNYVKDGQEGVYHCFSRCVRRAFLCGRDPLTGRDFSHRKSWILDRLRHLAAIFAIEVCAYAILENHYHSILRTRPDIVAAWSDREVATRWLILFPKHPSRNAPTGPPSELQIAALMASSEQIAECRRRLSSLSWFMGRLNEFIARAANKEDQVKGRFWESRFKCQALLDDAAVAAGMVYVDLNPIRAGLASTPEDCDFTSIQQRIRAWRNPITNPDSIPAQSLQNLPPLPSDRILPNPQEAGNLPGTVPARFPNIPISSADWLCPIQSDGRRRGILQMSEADYIDLVDRSARLLRADKRGSLDPGLPHVLLRIGANPQAWQDTISRFGSRFRLAAGLVPSLRRFASQVGRRWVQGVASARVAFTASWPRFA